MQWELNLRELAFFTQLDLFMYTERVDMKQAWKKSRMGPAVFT